MTGLTCTGFAGVKLKQILGFPQEISTTLQCAFLRFSEKIVCDIIKLNVIILKNELPLGIHSSIFAFLMKSSCTFGPFYFTTCILQFFTKFKSMKRTNALLEPIYTIVGFACSKLIVKLGIFDRCK